MTVELPFNSGKQKNIAEVETCDGNLLQITDFLNINSASEYFANTFSICIDKKIHSIPGSFSQR